MTMASPQPAPSTPPPSASAAVAADSGGSGIGSGGFLSPLTPIAPPCPPPPPIVSHIDRIVANLSDGFCGGGDTTRPLASSSTVPVSNAAHDDSIHARKRARSSDAGGGSSSSSSSSSTACRPTGTNTSTAAAPPDAGGGGGSSSSSSSSSTACRPTGTNTSTAAAPPGLESQYAELHRLLSRGLIGTKEDGKRNVSALLMGPRGCGKSLVLERVLHDLRTRCPTGHTAGTTGTTGTTSSGTVSNHDITADSNDDEKDDDDDDCNNYRGEGRFFRIVRLNGLLLRGDDVGAAVREMVRQLADVAVAEARYRQRQRRRRAAAERRNADIGGTSNANDESMNDDDDYAGSIASDLLRIRRQGFNSNLALLDETLRAARVDSMPVLVVLDELDAFLPTGGAGPAVGLGGSSGGGAGGSTSAASGSAPAGRRVGARGPRGESSGPASSDRQLLLYHLLDRVADHRTLLSLVGMTSQLSTVGTFEKRVRSRAEGTSKIIYLGRPASYEALISMLSSKFDVEVADEDDDEKRSCRRLGDQLVKILLPSRDRRAIDLDEESEDAKVRAMLRRNYQLGKDVRWFCRVLTVALSLLAGDCTATMLNDATSDTSGSDTSKLPGLSSRYLVEALMTMGGMLRTEEDTAAVTMNSGGGSALASTSRGGASRTSPNSIATYGPFDKHGRPTSMPGWDDPRIQELLDLPESQLAVLLSARRILCRDAAEDSSTPKPLTFGRIKREFETFYRGNVGSGLTTNLYEGDLLHFAFLHVMETGLICPAVDHTGGGPLQYYMHHTRTHAAMEPMALAKMPLHVLVDINSELGVLLKDKVLDCSTALREWGMRIN